MNPEITSPAGTTGVDVTTGEFAGSMVKEQVTEGCRPPSPEGARSLPPVMNGQQSPGIVGA